MNTTQQVATVPADLWATLVLRIRRESDPGLVALLDQIVQQTGVLTVDVKPVIPTGAAIPWGQT